MRQILLKPSVRIYDWIILISLLRLFACNLFVLLISVDEIKTKRSTPSNAEPQEFERLPFPNSDNIWSYHDKAVAERVPDEPQNIGAIDIERSQYLRSSVSPRTGNPYEEWIKLRLNYPELYEIAMQYLPILATSVPSERLFSKAGQIITKQRNRLSGKHLNMLLFLSSIEFETWSN